VKNLLERKRGGVKGEQTPSKSERMPPHLEEQWATDDRNGVRESDAAGEGISSCALHGGEGMRRGKRKKESPGQKEINGAGTGAVGDKLRFLTRGESKQKSKSIAAPKKPACREGPHLKTEGTRTRH